MICKKCKNSEFYKDRKCKICSRTNALKRYHSDPEKHKENSRKWKKQNGEIARAYTRKSERKDWLPGEHEKAEKERLLIKNCFCCGSQDPRSKKGWNADHNHKTKKFRAYVCHPCNIAISHVENFQLDRGPQIAKYLELFNENKINSTN